MKHGKEKLAILGTLIDGDLHKMTVRHGSGPIGAVHAFGLTWEQMTRHLILVGGTGTGKTVTQMRLASAAMSLGKADPSGPPIRILFLDAKGINHGNSDNRARFLELIERHNYSHAYTWPEMPIRGFDGDVHQVRERLSGLFRSDESPYHHAESVTMLDLALRATHPPRTLDELIERVRPGVTAALYESDTTQLGQLNKQAAAGFTAMQWNSLYLRLRALQATIGSSFDSNRLAWSLEQADAAWISIPGTAAPQTAGDIASWLLALIGELALSHNPRRTLVFLDEFSAVGQDARASQAVAGLVERTRSAGIALVIGSQTVNSLGLGAERLLHTAGTVISHRTPAPEPISSLAGTIAAWEDTQTVDQLGLRNATGGRLQQQYRIDPDLVRALPDGEAVVAHAGRWAHVKVSMS